MPVYINAASRVSEKEKRVISLTARVVQGMVSIHEENYFSGELTFQDHLPVTSSHDPLNHGFGMKSIQQIVGKYEGDLQIHIRDDVFSLDVLISPPSRNER